MASRMDSTGDSDLTTNSDFLQVSLDANLKKDWRVEVLVALS